MASASDVSTLIGCSAIRVKVRLAAELTDDLRKDLANGTVNLGADFKLHAKRVIVPLEKKVDPYYAAVRKNKDDKKPVTYKVECIVTFLQLVQRSTNRVLAVAAKVTRDSSRTTNDEEVGWYSNRVHSDALTTSEIDDVEAIATSCLGSGEDAAQAAPGTVLSVVAHEDKSKVIPLGKKDGQKLSAFRQCGHFTSIDGSAKPEKTKSKPKKPTNATGAGAAAAAATEESDDDDEAEAEWNPTVKLASLVNLEKLVAIAALGTAEGNAACAALRHLTQACMGLATPLGLFGWQYTLPRVTSELPALINKHMAPLLKKGHVACLHRSSPALSWNDSEEKKRLVVPVDVTFMLRLRIAGEDDSIYHLDDTSRIYVAVQHCVGMARRLGTWTEVAAAAVPAAGSCRSRLLTLRLQMLAQVHHRRHHLRHRRLLLPPLLLRLRLPPPSSSRRHSPRSLASTAWCPIARPTLHCIQR